MFSDRPVEDGDAALGASAAATLLLGLLDVIPNGAKIRSRTKASQLFSEAAATTSPAAKNMML